MSDALNLDLFQASDELLDELVRGAQQWADRWLEGGDAKSLMPHLFVSCRNAQRELVTVLVAMDLPLDSDLNKKLAMKRIATVLYEKHEIPFAVAFVCEAWASTEKEGGRRYLLPEDDPDRREEIVVMASDISMQKRRLSVREVKRTTADVMTWNRGWTIAPNTAPVRVNILGHFWRGFFENLPNFHALTREFEREEKERGDGPT